MGNRFENFKWIYIKSKSTIKIYSYHSQQEKDNFTRWSYTDLRDEDTEVTYKQALRDASNRKSVKIDISRVAEPRRSGLLDIFKKYSIEDTQIIYI